MTTSAKLSNASRALLVAARDLGAGHATTASLSSEVARLRRVSFRANTSIEPIGVALLKALRDPTRKNR